MVRRKAVLLNADYVLKGGKSYARLEVKGKRAAVLYYEYEPYFYVDAPKKAAKGILGILGKSKEGEVVSPKRIEEAELELGGGAKKLLKVVCNAPRDVPILEAEIELPCYEYSIPFGRRFMMDFGLMPLSTIHYEREGKYIKKFFDSGGDGSGKLNVMAFDIETYSPEGVPREGKDSVIMLSYSNGKRHGVLSWKEVPGKDFVEVVGGEKELIERFCALLDELDVDVLTAYNSTNFDLPYLKERAKRLKTELGIGRDGSSYRAVKRGLIQPLRIKGRVHVDLYPSVRFFGFTGMIKTGDYTLKNVYSAVTGKKKKMVERLDIWKMWDKGGEELEELSEYSLMDADSTFEVGEHILPIQMELSEITGLPLFDVAYATSGQLVEALLMREAVSSGIVVPPKPSGAAVNARSKNPIKGAYVKLPEPGIYENIAVFDFRGLYPSIICSYNIGPDTMDKKGESWEAPTGTKFLKKPLGLVPRVLGALIDRRAKAKAELKKLKKDSPSYKRAYARNYALKILANSFYGYLGYARSRWYNRSCAESITALGRKHIHETEKMAEEAGFRVLYSDSLPYGRHIVVQYPDGEVGVEKIGEFVRKNRDNPEISKHKTLAYDGKKLVFKPVRRVIEHKYDSPTKGKLLEFTTTHGKTVVTPQHSVYCFDEEKGKIKLVDAGELGVGDMLVSLTNPKLPEHHKTGEKLDMLSMDLGPHLPMLRAYADNLRFPPGTRSKCPYCRKEFGSLYSHVSVMHGDRKLGVTEAQKTEYGFIGGENAKTGRIPRFWKLTPELAWIMGYYCADGSVSERNKRHQKAMLSFGSQDRKCIKRIKRFFDGVLGEELGIIEDYDGRINKTMYYYRIQRIPIAALFKYGFGMGSGSAGKKVPHLVFSADERIKRAFVEGYLEGDGSRKHDKRYRTRFVRFTTKSKELAIGLQLLLKGFKPKKNKFGGFIKHVSWSYRKDKPGVQALRLSGTKRGKGELGDFCAAEIKEVNKLSETSSVFDLEVEGVHNFVDAEGLILVHNTDSVFLLLGEKKKEDAMRFLEKVNSSLPGKMELELEDFYTRGVFVSKKHQKEDTGAKKKYAMLSEDGSVKIRGFELVRRDWSRIARDTQKRVLEAILKEGSREKAVTVIQDVISRLRSGEVPLEEVAIYTQLKKSPDKYDIVSPELSAAKKAIKKGRKIGRGSIVAYVITRGGKSISDKAELLEFASNYDPQYYIDRQVLPSVMKILKELGYDEYELKHGGKQKGLGDWF